MHKGSNTKAYYSQMSKKNSDKESLKVNKEKKGALCTMNEGNFNSRALLRKNAS